MTTTQHKIHVQRAKECDTVVGYYSMNSSIQRMVFRRLAIRFHWFPSISLLATSHDMVLLMNEKQEVQVQMILDDIYRFALCKHSPKTFVAIVQAEYPEKLYLNCCRATKQNPKIVVSTPKIGLQKYFVCLFKPHW